MSEIILLEPVIYVPTAYAQLMKRVFLCQLFPLSHALVAKYLPVIVYGRTDFKAYSLNCYSNHEIIGRIEDIPRDTTSIMKYS